MQKRANLRGISLQSVVEKSCKVLAQTSFTYPNYKQNQATLDPVYEDYFFDAAEMTLDSTIDENISAHHSLVSNDEPINNKNITVYRTSSVKRSLCQQSFKAWLVAMDSISFPE